MARVATGERVDAGAGLATGGEGEAHSALSSSWHRRRASSVDLLLQATRGATEGMDGTSARRRARIYGGVGGGGRGREIGRRRRRGNGRKPLSPQDF